MKEKYIIRGVPGNPPGWTRDTNFHEIVPGNDELAPGNPPRGRTNTNFDEIAPGSPPGGRRENTFEDIAPDNLGEG